MTPGSGPSAGGTDVTITGTGLTGTTSVDFDGTAGTNLTVNPAGTSLTVATPAHAAGPVDVTVNNPGGNATATGGYTYLTAATGTTPPGTPGAGGNTNRAG
ncbi:IPT/TIG domain-containing protein [Leifsonia sp. NPDC102414]|uniref:IPT/TIG domain-containing protein n=1 Tax=Leifsonia sp. NPDC102414 TaxID=3364124 RepID=UPI00382FDDC6